MQQIQSLIDVVLSWDKGIVLAMVVDIEGSAYRKEGAWMLFKEGESSIGMVSGGCLENDLRERAEELFHTGKSELISYDMSSEDDMGWGRGVGCNGIVSVLLRDINSEFRNTLQMIQKSLLNKEPVVYIQSMDHFDDYTIIKNLDDVFHFELEDLRREWSEARPFESIVGQRRIKKGCFFMQLIWPQPHLYIVGGGIDARPLTNLATDVGFKVHVLDWREMYGQKKYFPKASTIHCGDVVKRVRTVSFSSLDSIILMTHDFQYDRKIIQELHEIDLFYFGVLGSKKRTERLMGGELPRRIQTPVGLPIGADGPVEIAVSIVAQLIAKKRGKSL